MNLYSTELFRYEPNRQKRVAVWLSFPPRSFHLIGLLENGGMNATALTLRLGTTVDAELIAAMSRIFVEDGLSWTWRPEKVAAEIKKPDTTVLVALDGRHLVGFAIMHYGDESAHLNLLTVHPEYRRAGVGRRMLRWLEDSARVAGVFSVALEVREQNIEARHFYQALGYHETAKLHRYYQGLEDAVRMHHDLSMNVHSS